MFVGGDSVRLSETFQRSQFPIRRRPSGLRRLHVPDLAAAPGPSSSSPLLQDDSGPNHVSEKDWVWRICTLLSGNILNFEVRNYILEVYFMTYKIRPCLTHEIMDFLLSRYNYKLEFLVWFVSCWVEFSQKYFRVGDIAWIRDGL